MLGGLVSLKSTTASWDWHLGVGAIPGSLAKLTEHLPVPWGGGVQGTSGLKPGWRKVTAGVLWARESLISDFPHHISRVVRKGGYRGPPQKSPEEEVIRTVMECMK